MLPIVAYTLTIYQRLYDRVPPLVPEDLKNRIESELHRLSKQENPSLEDVERSAILHGKELWPYIKAFEEMVGMHERIVADKIFVQKASPGLRKKYILTQKLGGMFKPVYQGKHTEHFDYSERQELSELLVELKQDIRRYVMQAVLTYDRKTYEEKIAYYGKLIEEINTIIHTLKKIKDGYMETHENLAQDIVSKIAAIEQSFAFMAPPIDIEEMRRVPEYYQGRREEEKMRWGK